MGVDNNKIKVLREKLGLSQADAADKAGLKSRQAWWNIESGHQANLTIAILEQIAAALGVRAKDLLK
jgi:transcriptional regulator with XRE-family HTH domain